MFVGDHSGVVQLDVVLAAHQGKSYLDIFMVHQKGYGYIKTSWYYYLASYVVVLSIFQFNWVVTCEKVCLNTNKG
jgi:hypothetical protein